MYVQTNRSYFLLLDHKPIQEQFENWNSLEKRANNYPFRRNDSHISKLLIKVDLIKCMV